MLSSSSLANVLLQPNPFLDRLRMVTEALNPLVAGMLIASGLGVFLFLLFSERRVEWVLLAVIGSSALVGSSNNIIDGGASVIRWVGIAVLMLTPLMQDKGVNPYRGAPALFLIHAVADTLFLFNAVDAGIQMQRAILLMVAVIALPSATALVAGEAGGIKKLYANVGYFGGIVALIAAIQLPGQLGVAGRFYGTAKGVPYFAIALGSLLPFMFLNAWNARTWLMKALCWFIFVAGAAVLLFTAQRAGTLGGLISMLPMLLVLSRTQRIRIVVAGIAATVALFVWSGASGLSSLEYVAGRYSTQTGLSGRDFLWQMAWNFISRNIFMGHGSGGADLVTQDLFHNSYLEAWYNGGIVGFVAFLAALGRAVYVGFALLRRVDKDIKIEIALSFGFVLGVCFVGFFEGVVAGASTITVILLMVTTTIMERFYYESRQTEEEHEGGDETETLAPDQTLN